MSELLLIYAVFSLATAHSALPLSLPGFMPFQENYWLWKVVGFGGLFVFQARWIVQWLYSEKHKESKIPVAFWWLSMTGAMLELFYFLRQQDSVGGCGYIFSVVPYSRNLVLIYRKRRKDAEAALQGFEPIPAAAGTQVK